MHCYRVCWCGGRFFIFCVKERKKLVSSILVEKVVDTTGGDYFALVAFWESMIDMDIRLERSAKTGSILSEMLFR